MARENEAVGGGGAVEERAALQRGGKPWLLDRMKHGYCDARKVRRSCLRWDGLFALQRRMDPRSRWGGVAALQLKAIGARPMRPIVVEGVIEKQRRRRC